jgi:transcriptional regulator with XRE-family HTH domain
MQSLQARLEAAVRRRPTRNADLARIAKVSTASVADWFSGKTKSLKSEPARRLATYFGCDRDWLAEGYGAPKWRDVDKDIEALGITEQVSLMPADLAPLKLQDFPAFQLAVEFDALPEQLAGGKTKRELFQELRKLIAKHAKAAVPIP